MALAPWATFNVNRASNTPVIDLTHFLHPNTVARHSLPLEPIQPAPKPAPRPIRRVQPAWAKSGDEIWAKLDAFNARPLRVN